MTCRHPILFLDMDGVVSGLEHGLRASPNIFSRSAVAVLNLFCQLTEAETVLTTARLRLQPANMLIRSLQEAGFSGAFHPESTIAKERMPFTRGQSISRWCTEQQQPEQAIIILDDSRAGYSPQQCKRLIQPEGKRLSENDLPSLLASAQEAEAALSGKNALLLPSPHCYELQLQPHSCSIQRG